MIKKFLMNRLREVSTWRGIIGFITIFGVALSPEQKELVAAAGATLYCAVLAFLPDNVEQKSTTQQANGGSPAQTGAVKESNPGPPPGSGGFGPPVG